MAKRSLVRNRNLGTVHVPHQIITSMKFQYREKLKLQELRFHQIAGDFPIGFKTTKNRWLSRIIPKCSASKSKLHIQKNYPIKNTQTLSQREREAFLGSSKKKKNKYQCVKRDSDFESTHTPTPTAPQQQSCFQWSRGKFNFSGFCFRGI